MNSDKNDSKKEILENANLRCTQARLDILDILQHSDTALTQKQITDSLKDKYDKVTIYRTLEIFVHTDIAHKAYCQEKIWHFELANRCGKEQCHPHFVCRLCGKNFCLVGTSYPAVQIPKNFQSLRQKVLIEGFCPDCKN
ncbi:MAG: transcriptional repressor [Phycisphaerae bacterium]|nr:transcriptional repressor [Phycisphaerae bacterium]